MYLNSAHHNMVEQQIRPWQVLDPKVLAAFTTIARENFVPENLKDLAYSDMQLPIGHGEKMLEPKIEGRMLQALNLKSQDKVLEIGTGSAFTTALLANICDSVHSIEINPELARFGKTNLEQASLKNISLEVADGLSSKMSRQFSYDVIVLTGSVREVPDHLLSLMNIGARMFVMLEKQFLAEATSIIRASDNEWIQDGLFETISTPLKQPPVTKVFKF